MRPSSTHSTTASLVLRCPVLCVSPWRAFTLAALGGRLLAVGRHEVRHALGGLGTLADPVVNARQIELQFLLVLAGDRIEEADVLQAWATLALAAVGHHDVIE